MKILIDVSKEGKGKEKTKGEDKRQGHAAKSGLEKSSKEAMPYEVDTNGGNKRFGERIVRETQQERRFADVRTAKKCDLGPSVSGPILTRKCAFHELGGSDLHSGELYGTKNKQEKSLAIE